MTRNLTSRLMSIGAVAAVVLVLGVGTGSDLLLGLGLAAGIVVGAWALWDSAQRSRHRKELATFAATHGWQFEPATTAYTGRFSGLPFESGVRRRQEDVLRGTFAGAQCATYTQVYETQRRQTSTRNYSDALLLDEALFGALLAHESGSRSQTQTFHVTLVELPVTLPRLDLVPEGVGTHAAKAFGGSDVDVESHAFNRRWRVIASDQRYAHAILDPRMIDRLLQSDLEGVSLRIDGGAVLLWSPGRRGTEDLARRLSVLTSVARRIPAHVVREYAEAGLARGEGRPISPSAPSWATTPGALTSGRWTGIEPGPAATGEGYSGLPSGDEDFDIFRFRVL
ncbi:DUF3137 domain-containing protein [Demequina sp. NBRC 110052]|uniref:DUF3137 domain-containing protein n=1 Tax=Demequina sp. NBRC 110052 TaxID=1570341 RepID=UPI00117CBF96|nr:DUF3137 domain-containing protein [Demequina sp. NBRC 110052]